MKRLHIIILIVFLFVISLYAEEKNTTIYLNTGDSLQVSVEETTEWGVITLDGRTINFKVINYIITDDNTVVNRIAGRLPEAETLRVNEEYKIIIPVNSLVKTAYKDNHILDIFQINLVMLFKANEKLELQLNTGPKFLKGFIVQFAGTYGWVVEEEYEETNKINKNELYVSAYSIGSGYKLDIAESRILFLLNYAYKSYYGKTSYNYFRHGSNSSESLKNGFVFYPSIYYMLGGEHFKVMLGLCYYFNDINFYHRENKGVVHAGFSITF